MQRYVHHGTDFYYIANSVSVWLAPGCVLLMLAHGSVLLTCHRAVPLYYVMCNIALIIFKLF
jgi:hypothetical protein